MQMWPRKASDVMRSHFVVVLFLLVFIAPAWAVSDAEIAEDLPTLEELQGRERPIARDGLSALVADNELGEDLGLKIRQDSMKEAAFSYGARGGLAWRTREIMLVLEDHDDAMEKAFDFKQLLVQAPSNMMIEPPIVSESLNNFIVSQSGDTAAVSDVMYNIARQAQIVSTSRNWRQYLWREWPSEIEPPPNILLPENARERKLWREWVHKGWLEGLQQANDIFEADLNLLVADFEGMVRYRVLVAENKISSPDTIIEDRGITGGGDQMRIGDRAIKITNPARLKRGAKTWKPGVQ